MDLQSAVFEMTFYFHHWTWQEYAFTPCWCTAKCCIIILRSSRVIKLKFFIRGCFSNLCSRLISIFIFERCEHDNLIWKSKKLKTPKAWFIKIRNMTAILRVRGKTFAVVGCPWSTKIARAFHNRLKEQYSHEDFAAAAVSCNMARETRNICMDSWSGSLAEIKGGKKRQTNQILSLLQG